MKVRPHPIQTDELIYNTQLSLPKTPFLKRLGNMNKK